MPKHQLIIATRESPLALKQANWVKQKLESLHPELNIILFGMTTQADRMLSISLAKVGGKGLFVKELEEALLDGRADIAVHSMKDMPMTLPDGLKLSVICEREDPRDAFISKHFNSIDELPRNAVVGTSSLRREYQLLALRPDLIIKPLRGNVNTRLQRLDEGDFAAIILATAGLKRLDIERPYYSLDTKVMLPAAGQGALGIEVRADDEQVKQWLQPLDHLETKRCVIAERALCKRLGGGCEIPIGAYAIMREEKIFLRGLVGSASGLIHAEGIDNVLEAEKLGIKVAEALLTNGAGAFLK